MAPVYIDRNKGGHGWDGLVDCNAMRLNTNIQTHSGYDNVFDGCHGGLTYV